MRVFRLSATSRMGMTVSIGSVTVRHVWNSWGLANMLRTWLHIDTISSGMLTSR